jgi:hypothetical protein
VEKIEVQRTSNNVFQLMLKALETFANVNVEILGGKLICIGTDGNSVFHSSKNGVTN